MEILVATHNLGKKKEIEQILPEHAITSLEDYQLYDEIIEDGATFAANAEIKAKFCYQKTGRPSLGDDSGLVVEALDGRPGIFSARYAGDHDFKANNAKVLRELKGEQNRNAYFVTVLCFFDGENTHFFEGRVYGKITEETHGVRGFGYDPIFIPEGYGRTFAEMSAEEKNKISHRSNALRQFVAFLNL